MKKKNEFLTLAQRTAMVFSASMAALTGATATLAQTSPNTDSHTIEINPSTLVKPMPVLKLNTNNPGDSQFIASHGSHRSHSSHSSHSSHRSHYSSSSFA